MTFKRRLTKLEKSWYSLEAEYYSRSWQELYEHDEDALKEREDFDNLIEPADPPYWFWPSKDDWERKLGWCISHDPAAQALFEAMFKRLKLFVDGGIKTENRV